MAPITNTPIKTFHCLNTKEQKYPLFLFHAFKRYEFLLYPIPVDDIIAIDKALLLNFAKKMTSHCEQIYRSSFEKFSKAIFK
jgi:hypothetical protein